ncbi:hypothetical protein F3J43_22795 [Pantoea sp. Cy-639]|nr:hypothetical protein [Pantoea sp. Cy-639]
MHAKENLVDEFTEKEIRLNQGEINALKKALLYLKFECEETESLIFSGSPLINSAFDKLIAGSDSAERELKFYEGGNSYAEECMLNKLKRQWEFYGEGEFEDDVDSEYFRECIRPYKKA